MNERRTIRDEGRKHGLMGKMLVLVGLALILEHALGVDINFIFVVLGVAFGIFAKKGATWAWIPAGLFLLEPTAQLVSGLVGAQGVPSVSLPLIVMAGGGVLVFRDRMPPGMARASLVGLLILAVLNLGGAGRGKFDRDNDRTVNVKRVGVRNLGERLPTLGGKTLVVSSDEGDVTIETSTVQTTELEEADVTVAGDKVIVKANDRDINLTVLPGTNVIVSTDEGDVRGKFEVGGSIVIETDEGDVDLEVVGDPTVTLKTTDGDIDLTGYETDGSDESFVHSGRTAGSIVVQTDDGEIDLTRVDARATTASTAPPEADSSPAAPDAETPSPSPSTTSGLR